MPDTRQEEEKGAAAAASEEEEEEEEEDVQSDSEMEDAVRDSGSKRQKLEASPFSYADLLPYYRSLDDFLIDQDKGFPNFTHEYRIWSDEPEVDRQYKTLYDKLMDIPNFYEEVCEAGILRRSHCKRILEAEKVADDDQFCYMDDGAVYDCLRDMQKEDRLVKELAKLKEYEKCLLDSRYWKKKEGESAPVELEEYQPYVGFRWTGYDLAEVKREFESWLLELGNSGREEEELQKRVEDAHANRLIISKGFVQSRIRYIRKKFEHCRKDGFEFEFYRQVKEIFPTT